MSDTSESISQIFGQMFNSNRELQRAVNKCINQQTRLHQQRNEELLKDTHKLKQELAEVLEQLDATEKLKRDAQACFQMVAGQAVGFSELLSNVCDLLCAAAAQGPSALLQGDTDTIRAADRSRAQASMAAQPQQTQQRNAKRKFSPKLPPITEK